MVTGERQAGKSSSLFAAVDKLRQKGLQIGGILALGEDYHGQRKGFQILDLQSGQKALLCRKVPPRKGVRIGPYQFYPEGLALAYKALAPSYLQEMDLIVVDEVGPLELRGEGLAQALDQLVSFPKPQVWVVRKCLLKEVWKNWGLKGVITQEVKKPKDPAVYKILERLFKQTF